MRTVTEPSHYIITKAFAAILKLYILKKMFDFYARPFFTFQKTNAYTVKTVLQGNSDI